MAVGPALANADDAARIKRCVSDNKNEGQAATVVASYCARMNVKMSETQSISTREKSHETEADACSKEAG